MPARRKWMIVGLVAAIAALAAMALLSVQLVNSFKPYGHYEGYWEGTFRLEAIRGDEAGVYASFMGENIDVVVEIDEQSRGYGHLALAFREDEFLSLLIEPEFAEPVFMEPVLFQPGSLAFDPASKVAGTLHLSTEKGMATLTGSLIFNGENASLSGELVIKESETGTPLLDF